MAKKKNHNPVKKHLIGLAHIQGNLIGAYDLICAGTGKILKENIDPYDYEINNGFVKLKECSKKKE